MPIIAKAAEASGLTATEEDQDPDAQDASVPLMESSDNLVQHLNNDPFTVDAERVDGEMGGELRAQATLPCEFAATLSDNFTAGTNFTVQGPLGPIRVEPPPDAKPGMTLRYRLAPKPDFRVQVPPGGKPGSPVTFKRADGVEISVVVPEGYGPGDSFDVTPPALMVKVPEGASQGDFVVFPDPSSPPQAPDWFRAQVPSGLQPNQFMTARLPAPKLQKQSAQPKQGWRGWGGAAFRWGQRRMSAAE
mmetsp:Transcript_76241/g.176924  ORF Transcript_76241/g.176924 Transcript_76241/m.176924 type:complete len:247 (+) Transcript_76241:80-820(+)